MICVDGMGFKWGGYKRFRRLVDAKVEKGFKGKSD